MDKPVTAEPTPRGEASKPRTRRSPLRPAGTWRRIAAATIDVVFLYVVVGTLATDAVTEIDRDGVLGLGWLTVSWIVFSVAYVTGLEWWCGQTLGKRAMGIRVCRFDGSEHVSLWRIVARFALLGIDVQLIGLIGLLLVGFARDKQRVGDVVADTVVVKVARRPVLDRWLHPERVPQLP